MTNEQAVIDAGHEISALKKNYMDYLNPLVERIHANGSEPSLSELLKCQQLGSQYFNYVESFVGNSGLLGAHANGLWVTGFAETCHSILNVLIVHANFLNSYSKVANGNIIPPDETAFANMQRMSKEYLPKEKWSTLRDKFIDNSLPTSGFDYKEAKNLNKTPKWQLITSVVIGCIALIASVVIAIFIPEPTTYQVFILRGLFAIALASIASIIPGFLNLETGARSSSAYFGIFAGGAIAIFVLIWLFNPPVLVEQKTNENPMVVDEKGS